MARYRKQPVVVEAVQLLPTTWTEMCTHANVGRLTDDRPEGCFVDKNGKRTHDVTARIGLLIPTLEGVMLAVEGDWIIRGVKGELYACKPDIFEMTYVKVEGE